MSSLRRLLEQELDCFNHILGETESFYSKFNTYSQDSLIQLLESRQKWIDIVKRLEFERKEIQHNNEFADVHVLREHITNMAKALVVIDARILNFLQIVKSSYVNNMAEILPRKNENIANHNMSIIDNQIVDIIQE